MLIRIHNNHLMKASLSATSVFRVFCISLQFLYRFAFIPAIIYNIYQLPFPARNVGILRISERMEVDYLLTAKKDRI